MWRLLKADEAIGMEVHRMHLCSAAWSCMSGPCKHCLLPCTHSAALCGCHTACQQSPCHKFLSLTPLYVLCSSRSHSP